MIDQSVLETMTKTLRNVNLTENVVKNCLEALQKITSSIEFSLMNPYKSKFL